ncbi:cation-transporting ATPase [Curtobacterium flaccumfaciens pv. flaccumfaciens]|uniref:cation-transporting ATPase n=1 Tax=Curtobacterium flaccumfaciens TaxID=2035 RepID=UPI00217E968E|nr:cation-transporting ATPase [Curtobacterium flaccumfaciens]MCS6549323.1 cation-transporting ATPase [Curtobacterium flaccumfaciens pv. flaccumfaciens]
MANLNRIIGMASKVIDKQLQKRGQGGTAPGAGSQQGGTDWRGIVRSAADKLTGDDRNQQQPPQQYGQPPQQQYGQPQPAQYGQPQQHAGTPQHGTDADKVALAKYDYLLRTSSPEQLEQVHHDAFARLTPAQRQQVRDRLNSELPPHEHLRDDSAGGMARAMTRGEMSRPGLVRRVLAGSGRSGNGNGRGGAFAGGAAVGAGAMAFGGLAAAVAGGAVLSAAAGPVLAGAADLGVDFEGIASGMGDLALGDLGGGVEGLLGEGEQLLGGFGEQAAGFGEQASGLGEQASNLGNDFLGGLFDR